MRKIILQERGSVKTKERLVRKKSTSLDFDILFYTIEGVENNLGIIEKLKKSIDKSIKKKKKEKVVEEKPVVDDSVERFFPKFDYGLSEEQVKKRTDANLVNKAATTVSKTYKSIFLKNIFTFFNMIWLVIAIALLVVGAYKDLTFVFIVVPNTVIAIIQEIRAKHAVEKLSIVTAPKVKTLRDGKVYDTPAEELVLDDIIILTSGNQIPSDCIVLDGLVEVNESLLTGESNAIEKQVGAPLLSGSFVVSGTCYAKVDKIGNDNYIHQMAKKAKEFKTPQSNLFKDINRLIKYIGIALVPIGIMTFLSKLSSMPIKDTIRTTCGSLAGMIPAGMFLLVTISLAVGVIKLSKKKTLVRDSYSIEMLARTNVLCLDKTGTITDGTMKVVDFVTYTNKRKVGVKKLLSNVLNVQKTMNATSNAMIQEFGRDDEFTALNIAEFSSQRKYSITQLSNKKIYFLGASTRIGCPLTDEQVEFIKEQQNKGLRVLALAEQDSGTFDKNMNGTKSVLIALIVLEEKIRDDAVETIQWFKDNGVEIKIISGDDPATVSKIAARVGVRNSDKFVSLEGVSLKDLEQMADEFTVFGRVTPEQKYTIIKALKNKGKVVAMTGDGVNDTLALKEADCSIAMADGSEVARSISKIVLLESNFSSLPSVVREGRQVINNVQNSSSLFLMKTFFVIALTLLTLFLPNLTYPFTTNMLMLLEFFVIGIPSFLLTFEPNTKPISGNFIPQVLKRALPRSLLMLINILIVMGLKQSQSIPTMNTEEYITICVLILTYTGFLNLTSLCLPANLLKIITMTVSFVGVTVAIIVLPTMFEIRASSFIVFVAFFAIILASIILITLIKLNRKTIDKLRDKVVQLLQKEQ